MDFSFSELNYIFVETLPSIDAALRLQSTLPQSSSHRPSGK